MPQQEIPAALEGDLGRRCLLAKRGRELMTDTYPGCLVTVRSRSAWASRSIGGAHPSFAQPASATTSWCGAWVFRAGGSARCGPPHGDRPLRDPQEEADGTWWYSPQAVYRSSLCRGPPPAWLWPSRASHFRPSGAASVRLVFVPAPLASPGVGPEMASRQDNAATVRRQRSWE
jgi:hypothetical protein